MLYRNIFIIFLIVMSVSAFCEGSKEKQIKPVFESYMYSGGLAKGEEALVQYLKYNAGDNQARFELGIVVFIRGVERLAQSIYRFGPATSSQFIPLFSLPVPENKHPETVTYEKFRAMIESFNKDMIRVIDILGSIEGNEISVPLYIGKIKLDIDSNKTLSDWETLWVMYSRVNANARVTAKNAETFAVDLDKADVHWLSGYCHLLAGVSDFLLSFEFKKLFDFIAPYAFLQTAQKSSDVANDSDMNGILILRTLDKGKKKSAIEHLLGCFAQSRKCFEEANGETDDNREWIPNASQASVIPGVRVSKDMAAYWGMFLTEAEAIVSGKKLIPLYQTDISKSQGLNFNKMILEEKPINLSLLFKTSTLPWVESGRLTDYRFWTQLVRVFGGEFIGFAIWFN